MKLFTISDLSDNLSISKKTIYYWVSLEKIPYIKAGKHLRFDYKKVLEHLEQTTKKSSKIKQVTQPTKDSSLKIEQEMRRRGDLQKRRL